jgi:hypothetical protein
MKESASYEIKDEFALFLMNLAESGLKIRKSFCLLQNWAIDHWIEG